MNFKLSHQRGVFPSKNMTVSRDLCSCILKRFLSVANENKIMIASPALCVKKKHTKIQMTIPASIIVKMANTNIGQLSKIDDVNTFWYTPGSSGSCRLITSIPGTCMTGRYLLNWLPRIVVAVTGKLRSGSLSPCPVKYSITSSVSPCSSQYLHVSLITSEIILESAPSLSRELGCNAVLTFFSHRQVSTIAKKIIIPGRVLKSIL